MGKLRNITEQQLIEIVEALNRGDSWVEVVDRYPISRSGLEQLIARRNLPVNRKYRGARPVDLSGLVDTDLAYLAGILDGEGSIVFVPGKKFPTWRVMVYSTDRPLIEWLHGLGGHFYTRKPGGLGSHSKLTQFGWHLQRRADVLIFLEALAPFMRIKLDKANTAIASIRALSGEHDDAATG